MKSFVSNFGIPGDCSTLVICVVDFYHTSVLNVSAQTIETTLPTSAYITTELTSRPDEA